MQQTGSVAVGVNAGRQHQKGNSVAVGYEAGDFEQSPNCLAVGYRAAKTSQSTGAVAVGYQAGLNSQGSFSVAMGQNAGLNNQSTGCVAIGHDAGQTSQKHFCVALGGNAGQTNQDIAAVAVGYDAGLTSQSIRAVAVGEKAGKNTQGVETVAIGYLAGQETQGNSSVCIGSRAGQNGCDANNIIINGSGNALNGSPGGKLFIKPIYLSNVVTPTRRLLYYNNDSGEVDAGFPYAQTWKEYIFPAGQFYDVSQENMWMVPTNLTTSGVTSGLYLIMAQVRLEIFPNQDGNGIPPVFSLDNYYLKNSEFVSARITQSANNNDWSSSTALTETAGSFASDFVTGVNTYKAFSPVGGTTMNLYAVADVNLLNDVQVQFRVELKKNTPSKKVVLRGDGLNGNGLTKITYIRIGDSATSR
jgi:hypothetical protein